MIFKIKNITFDFIYQSSIDDAIGDASMTVAKDTMEYVIVELSGLDIDWNSFNFEEEDCQEIDSSTSEYSNEEVLNWLEEEDRTTFTTYNTDFQIIIFSVLLESDKEYIIEYAGENPFWIFHDINHALYDVASGSIYVDKYIEEERMFDGLELAKECEMLKHANLDLFQHVKVAFKERWNYNFDIDSVIEYLNENQQ